MKKEKSKIKAVFSDAGHILFDESRRKNAFLDYVGHLRQQNQVLHLDVDKFWETYRANKLRAFTEYGYDKRRAYKDTLDALGVSYLYEPFMAWIGQRPKIKTTLNPEVKKTVSELSHKGIDFIVLSDASHTAEELKSKLSKMGLNRGIKGVLSSKDLGYCKPDKRFFNEALKRYGLKKEEVVFVGHDLDELEGAHKLGFRTVALNYNPKDLPSIGYSTKIESFGDLLKVVEKRPKYNY